MLVMRHRARSHAQRHLRRAALNDKTALSAGAHLGVAQQLLKIDSANIGRAFAHGLQRQQVVGVRLQSHLQPFESKEIELLGNGQRQVAQSQHRTRTNG